MLPNCALAMVRGAPKWRVGGGKHCSRSASCLRPGAILHDAFAMARDAPELGLRAGQEHSRIVRWRWPSVLPNCALAVGSGAPELRLGCGQVNSRMLHCLWPGARPIGALAAARHAGMTRWRWLGALQNCVLAIARGFLKCALAMASHNPGLRPCGAQECFRIAPWRFGNGQARSLHTPYAPTPLRIP